MQLELRHLEAVCRIADAGSLARAARLLGVSQPALSAQLRRIERVAGGELFERGPAGVVPTPLGEYVLDRARRVLGEMEELAAGVRSVPTAGPLRLGCMSIALLAAMLTKPDPRVAGRELTVENVESLTALVRQLTNGRYDAILYAEMGDREAVLPEGSRVRTLVAREPVYVGISAAHPLAAREEIALADLAGEQWLAMLCEDDGGPEQFARACSDAGFTPVFRYRLSDWQLNRRMIAAGGAVGLYQPTARERDGLALRPLTGEPLSARIKLAWLRSGLSAPFADALYDAAAGAYLASVDNNPRYRDWWDDHPEAHPEVRGPG
ncbi:Hydrogen peroxide-inducible genes activator [Streptomyces sp. RB5]|uniref:Hydrogen peroxide-inducible genes activator n=1 Tax=Streptomyces smaragdinus TaxID=2585196 RepID=A0A7K0CGE9_9ACTN|nr:LysR family transcriptional regulator [Streptomyces smaragdinus]MQY12547.1 Hydrogen peroxide-inducible genes activator [Streptomyces smaragdinus]